MQALAVPPPSQIEMTPYRSPRRSISFNKVVVILVPVEPKGWPEYAGESVSIKVTKIVTRGEKNLPSAQAPPFTFIFLGSALRALIHERGTGAKAERGFNIQQASRRQCLKLCFLLEKKDSERRHEPSLTSYNPIWSIVKPARFNAA